MASRTMHLAVAEQILQERPVKDKNRFLLGILLPDAEQGPHTKKSHFEIEIKNSNRKTYDLTRFRQLFGSRLRTDGLYLGYYLHLIQDIVYRPFMYEERGWRSSVPGNVARMHNDFRLLNHYVTETYGLSPLQLTVPADFAEEEINQMYPPDLEFLLEGLAGDWRPYHEGEIFFFTEEMTDQYIKRALEVCLEEVRAIDQGRLLLDEMAYTWVER